MRPNSATLPPVFSRRAVGAVQVEAPAARILLSPTIMPGDFRKNAAGQDSIHAMRRADISGSN
jgi:hypothetical protein